jgi:hypothetical protein
MSVLSINLRQLMFMFKLKYIAASNREKFTLKEFFSHIELGLKRLLSRYEKGINVYVTHRVGFHEHVD